MNAILHSRMKKRVDSMKPVYICEKCNDRGYLDRVSHHCSCPEGYKFKARRDKFPLSPENRD